MPDLISLCVKTVFAHNDHVTLLDQPAFDGLFTDKCTKILTDKLASTCL